jgi:hypothetical protein
MGVTLNPTFFGEDMKFFWLRPSMMGWIMLNIGWAATQVNHPALSKPISRRDLSHYVG